MKMKFLILLAFVYLAVSASSLSEQWREFKLNHEKTYKSAIEEARRFVIFQENLKNIEKHNVKYENGESSFKMGLNKFADKTLAELKALMLLPKITRPKFDQTFDSSSVDLGALPESFDWTTMGAVTEVKDQGRCGSCYAFSSTASIESAHFQKTGELINLSEQQIVDCSTNFGNDGCDGGLSEFVYDYVEKYGLAKLEDYPYTAKDQTCQNVTGYVWVKSYVHVEHTEDALQAAVGTVGPISVAIAADDLFFYESGVFDERCSKYFDHEVLVVGYGTEDGKDYWRIKNSWGTDWGEKGFAKLVRHSDICGIADHGVYPVLK